ncbi:DUF4489 domain-containing protein [Anaerovorax sp. IOR16]|uniref:DUF4489 domain-containing protein n=1 Tax=Anaerovorax sp. IOR16 TaxID=2773458 RepID=UPI0019CF943F|nr:DUF4489 domain-containing protein [Anaerovorax sp. IOR16]
MGYIGDCYYCEPSENNEQGKPNGKEKNFCLFAKHPKPKEILMECGCNPQDAHFEIYGGWVKRYQKFVLDKVIIDTTCLCRPIVKIEFSSLIYFKGEAKNGGGGGGRAAEGEPDGEMLPEIEAETETTVRSGGGDKELEIDLLFELVKVCKGNEETVQSWRYKKRYEIECNDDLEVVSSEPFTVTFCDRACSDCCEYKMIVRGKDFDGCFDAVRVIKPDISAIAQGLCDC